MIADTTVDNPSKRVSALDTPFWTPPDGVPRGVDHGVTPWMVLLGPLLGPLLDPFLDPFLTPFWVPFWTLFGGKKMGITEIQEMAVLPK